MNDHNENRLPHDYHCASDPPCDDADPLSVLARLYQNGVDPLMYGSWMLPGSWAARWHKRPLCVSGLAAGLVLSVRKALEGSFVDPGGQHMKGYCELTVGRIL
jgi:hypothetical protein